MREEDYDAPVAKMNELVWIPSEYEFPLLIFVSMEQFLPHGGLLVSVSSVYGNPCSRNQAYP